MKTDSLLSISPLDGRYNAVNSELRHVTSEYGLIKYRLFIEVEWFKHLAETTKIKELPKLSHKNILYLNDLVNNELHKPSIYSFEGMDKSKHEMWLVDEETKVSKICDLFNTINRIYIADGHHRMDALLKLSKIKQHQNSNHTGKEAYNYFMIAIFPTSQARILDYNRLIKDLYGYSHNDFIKEIKKKFKVEKQNSSYKPKKSQVFGMYLEKQWYSLELKEKPHQNLFHIINLDINLLHYYLLEPTLGIGDPRYDNRIDFLAGFHGLEGIEKKVNSGEAEVGFALFPTQIDNIISFADRKLNMPPKSTWFDPKPLDGLVAYDFE